MTVVSHRAGPWLGLTGANAWAILDLAESDQRVGELSSALGATDLSLALDVLSSGGVAATPPFAMAAVVEGQVRYLVRGAAIAVLTAGDSSQTVTGLSSPTWVDAYAMAGTSEVRLCAPSTGADGGVFAGVGRVGELRIDVSTSSTPTTSAAADTAVSESADEAAAGEPEESSAGSYESVFFELLTANTTTRDALAQALTDASADPAPNLSKQPAPEPPREPEPSQVKGETATWQSTWQPSREEPLPPVPPELSTAQAPTAQAPTAQTPPPPPPPLAPGAIIDALPWETAAPPQASQSSPASPPPAASAAPVFFPSPTPSNVPPTLPVPRAESPTSAESSEADVTRVRSALLRHLSEAAPSGPAVWAAICPNRHWSPPYAPHCRVCGAPVADQQPQQISRPPLGRLTVSTGANLTLDRGVILGRAPQSAVDGADRPHLIKLDSPEISRLHAEVRLVEWQVFVRDLGSGNGTTLTLPGRAPERLRPQEEYTLEPGSVIGIADLVSVAYEVLG